MPLVLTSTKESYLIQGVRPSAYKIVQSALSLSPVHHQFPVQNWLRLGTWVLGRLEAVADVESTASRRVLEKAGFATEVMLMKYIILKGKARDGVIYSRLADDPKQLD